MFKNFQAFSIQFFVLFFAIVVPVASAQTFDPFITTWKTDNPGDSDDQSIRIPMIGNGYDFTVDWGDGNDEDYNTNPGVDVEHFLEHTYASAGEYEVKITGDFPRIYINSEGDEDKILTIDQWGDIAWTSMKDAFRGASNLTYNATDAPDLSGVTDLSGAFRGTDMFNGDIGNWDVSTITDMSSMFAFTDAFNQDIGYNPGTGEGWDVSNVTNMNNMFQEAEVFNQDIGGWDVSGVNSMSDMFSEADAFNQDIGDWNVSNVTTMEGMFFGTDAFNQDIGYDPDSEEGWDVSSVTDMSGMFAFAGAFNQDISGWDVSGVTLMLATFFDAGSFNQNLGGWDISSVTTMESMLGNSGLSTENYDATLTGWAAQTVESDVDLGVDGLTYCDGADARGVLTGAPNNWTITGDEIAEDCGEFRPFITTWKTDNPGVSNDLSIRIPMIGNGYDFNVDWGDGSDEDYNTNPGDDVEHFLEHTYTSAGTYTVKITGDFPRIFFNNGGGVNPNTDGDHNKILTIEQWGDIEWSSMEAAFYGASNLTYNATDAPDLSGVTSLASMFRVPGSSGNSEFNGDIGNWNVSTVTTMEGMFQGADKFNQNIGGWDVSNVTTMENMFLFARAFNQDIGGWDVSNVENMDSMFQDVNTFNQDIGGWNVSSVTNMNSMFSNAHAFNQDISDWDVSSVTTMRGMFNDTRVFNQDIGEWDVSKVTDMGFMFSNTDAFDQDIGDWDVSNVTDMSGMFYGQTEPTPFNQDISQWDVSKVTDMGLMFSRASSFNQDIGGWDVSKVTNMRLMFSQARNFNQDIGDWDVSSVEDMDRMFFVNIVFNQDINMWDVSNVINMYQMFAFTDDFDQDIGGWDVSSVKTMQGMFSNSEAFNQNLGDWDIQNVSSMANMFDNSVLSTQNYDNTLIGWESQIVMDDVPLGAVGLEYCDGKDARDALINDHNWDITGDSENCTFAPFITTWKTDNPGDSDDQSIRIPMIGNGYDFQVDWGDGSDEDYINDAGVGVSHFIEHTYTSAGEYEVKISGTFPRIHFNNLGDREKILTIQQWGDIEWSSMNAAFAGASNVTYSATDEPDLSAVNSMAAMFNNARDFNGDLSSWDVSNINDMSSMFSNATSFNGNVSTWNVSNVTNMEAMFNSASAFNQDLSEWIVGNVENMGGMFNQVSTFDQDISGWNVESVTDMRFMFFEALAFNQDISDWDVSNVEQIRGMFSGAENFNQNISNWDVSGIEDMVDMFANASSFDQNLSGWDISSITTMAGMLDGSGLSTENYDNTLIGWESQSVQNGVTLGAEDLTYCNGETARQALIDDHNWTIDDDVLAGDCTSPEGEDQQILVSNASDYEFTKSDFGVSNDNFSIKIETLPDEGTLLLDDDPVSPDDEIPIQDINSGEFTWELPDGEYGYNFTSFDFTIIDDSENQSEEAFTLTIDLGTVFVDLSGSQGWRFMSSPSDGDSYVDLLSGITLNLEFPNRQTLYELDQPNYAWDPVSSTGDEPGVSTPFIVYVVDGDLPATLESGENWSALDGTFSYSGLDFTDMESNPDSFYLLGNPHPIALDFCEFTSADVAVSVNLWDPQAGGGNGDYVALSCAVDDEVAIAPFQAFWVRTTDANPSLEIPEEAYLETTTDGYFKEVENGLIASATTAGNTAQAEPSALSQESDGYSVAFNVTSRDGIFTNTARLIFGREATPTLDTWDAPKLSPEGLAPKWLSFYSMDEEGRSYAIQSLPEPSEDQTRIPLDIQTTQAGTFTLDWQLPESHQLSAEYFLRDNQSGEVIELNEGNSYSFEVDAVQTSKVSKTLKVLKNQPVRFEARFELLITTDGSDGFAGLGDLPSEFTLNQNYPNPFNPTTIISYELPQASQVRLEVYDMAGRQVATLVSGQVTAGRHTVNFDASNLSSGVYLYRLQAGSSLQTRKLTILK